jgi:hypothetical protein
MNPARIFLVLVGLPFAVLAACSIKSETGDFGPLPDQASFLENDVSPFLEARCGGLDCHGQQGRPLRIYGQTGLRLKEREDGTRDNSATTDDERKENYRSIVGLEPEALSTCFRTKGDDIANFQLLLKPLDIENGGIRHKGGPVLRPSDADPGWQCLFGWVSGKVEGAECRKATKIIP